MHHKRILEKKLNCYILCKIEKKTVFRQLKNKKEIDFRTYADSGIFQEQ